MTDIEALKHSLKNASGKLKWYELVSYCAQAADAISEVQAENAAKDEENLRLHRQLAAVELDARTAWERYENANSSRKHAEEMLALMRCEDRGCASSARKAGELK